VDVLQQYTVAVRHWLLSNGLQLNPSKSDVIQFVTGRGRERVDDVTSIHVSHTTIQPSCTLKSLGVTLDKQLSFDQHIVDVCKACYFHIRALRHVRESLTDDVATTVACSIISSRLDYCNSLFTGMSAANFAKLQHVQNTLALVLQRCSKHDHITPPVSPALIQLHWLPIQQRATYKLATLTFKTLSFDEPSYLSSLLITHQPI